MAPRVTIGAGPQPAGRRRLILGVISTPNLSGVVRTARPIVIGLILAGCAAALYAEWPTINEGVSVFRHASLPWVAAGIGAECASMSAFALLQRQLLRAGDARLTLGTLLAISYTGNAITGAVPVAGSGLAIAYSERQFRNHGADPARVGVALVVAGIISAVAFSGIVAVAAILTGNPAAAFLGLVTSTATAAAVACLVVVVHSPRGRARLQPVVAAVLRLAQRTVRRPSGDPADLSAAALRRLSSVRLSTSAITLSFAWALVNWSADALCLAAAIAAARVAVPWSRLLLAWSAGSAAGSFSPTPFGLGVVDVALIVALHGAGMRAGDAVGAVLLYRVITFKILVTLICVVIQYLRDRDGSSAVHRAGLVLTLPPKSRGRTWRAGIR